MGCGAGDSRAMQLRVVGVLRVRPTLGSVSPDPHTTQAGRGFLLLPRLARVAPGASMSPRFLSRLRRPPQTPRSHDPVREAALVWQFGCRLRALRERRGLTRGEVSQTTGIKEEVLTLVEAGRLEPTLSAHLVPLARALDVSLTTLFEGAALDAPAVSPDMGTVLRAMATEVSSPWLSLDLSEETDLPSGRLYPALATLERGGMVADAAADPGESQTVPDLRHYVLTPLGEEMARFVPPA